MFNRLAIGALILASAGIQHMKANQTYNFSATEAGWYQDTGNNSNSTGQNNYFVGQFPVTNGHDYNDYFVFQVSGVVGNILSATLTLQNPDVAPGDSAAGLPVTFNIGSETADSFSDVTGNAPNSTVYSDLATGTQFGSQSVSTSDSAVIVNFTSAASALGSAGLNFVIGGYTTGIPDSNNHYLFTNTSFLSGANLPLLSIVTDATTPEPASLLLIGTGLAALGLVGRKRFFR